MNEHYFWGALSAFSLVAGLFFLRFWRLSRDRLFLFFAAAFWTLAVHWTVLAVFDPDAETMHYHYLARLLAFGLIIAGVLDKNRRGRPT